MIIFAHNRVSTSIVNMAVSAVIRATGMYVPDRIVTNQDMMQIYDTSDEWIVERSGIKERRFISQPMGPADLAYFAVQDALRDANLSPQDIDMIVFATLSPECWFPGSGCFLQAKLPFRNIPALDIRMQCSGFIYGLSVAHQYIRSGMYRNILVIGSEVQSTSLDPSPEGRTVGVLFGDGCGVAVVCAAEDETRGIQSTHLYSEGKFAEELWVPEPSSKHFPKVNPDLKGLFPYMNGREVFKQAVTRMSEVIDEALQQQNWKPEDVKQFFIHQANARIVTAVAERLNLPLEKFFVNIHKYGNTTSASIPICIHEANQAGILQAGDKIIATAFGSGFAWGAATIIW
jgi:3-oxoacyl-[acyl-carrier-protein] synthase-3